MDFFHGHGVFKRHQGGFIALLLGFGDKSRIHALVFVLFAALGCDQVFRSAFDTAKYTEMRVGMDGFRGGSRAEQFGYLAKSFLVCFLRESEIFTVGLALSGKGFLKIIVGAHGGSFHSCLYWDELKCGRGDYTRSEAFRTNKHSMRLLCYNNR